VTNLETQWALIVTRSDREAEYLRGRFKKTAERLCTTWDDKLVLVFNVGTDDVPDMKHRGARMSDTRDEARRLGLALHG